jgi:hypothetical protein
MPPMVFNWFVIRPMFAIVQSCGWMSFAMAAFSAGSPNASKPIGIKTLKPCMTL